MKTNPNPNQTSNEGARPQTVALGKTIKRGPAGWCWTDGTNEPRAIDLTLSQFYNFTVRSGRWVEVPVFMAETVPALAWVKDAGYTQAESTDPVAVHEFLTRFPERKQERVQAYLVPSEDWDKPGSEVVGFCYRETDLPHLVEKARTLGYEWPTAAEPVQPPGSKPPQRTAFEHKELQLMADAQNGITPELWDDDTWQAYTEGSFLRCGIRDALLIDRLDLKWGVDAFELLNKLDTLTPADRRLLIRGIAEFWAPCQEPDAEDILVRVAAELNA